MEADLDEMLGGPAHPSGEAVSLEAVRRLIGASSGDPPALAALFFANPERMSSLAELVRAHLRLPHGEEDVALLLLRLLRNLAAGGEPIATQLISWDEGRLLEDICRAFPASVEDDSLLIACAQVGDSLLALVSTRTDQVLLESIAVPEQPGNQLRGGSLPRLARCIWNWNALCYVGVLTGRHAGAHEPSRTPRRQIQRPCCPRAGVQSRWSSLLAHCPHIGQDPRGEPC